MDLNQINFHVFQQLESTNKYAMEMVTEGLAHHLDALFAIEQTEGKGQRGKIWHSNPGENIALSVVISPQQSFRKNPFLINAFIAIICRDFITQLLQLEVKIKWPNDLYINDKKAGGILIENRFSGKNWKWAVVGIGINVNQTDFPTNINGATSLKLHSNLHFEPVKLAQLLHKDFINALGKTVLISEKKIWEIYNQHLFKKGLRCKLIINGVESEATVSHVNNEGLMALTQNGKENLYKLGEIDWNL